MSNAPQAGGNNTMTGFAILVFIAILWWLRWVILAAAAVTAMVCLIRFVVRRRRAQRAAEFARIAAIRFRAVTQNAQVLRGDPAGFFGEYPIPDPELIPRWYPAA